MKFFFLYLLFSKRSIPFQKNKVIEFWKNNETFGFFNSKGNVYQHKNNSFECILETSPFLKKFHSFQENSFHYQITENGQDTSVFQNHILPFQKISWDDSTSHQTFFHNHFFRLNYFGDFSIISDQGHYKNCMILKYNEYFIHVISIDSFLISITNYNELQIFDFQNFKFSKKFERYLTGIDFVFDIQVSKFHEYLYITILDKKNQLRVFTFYIEKENTLRFIHQNNIYMKEKVLHYFLEFPNIYIKTNFYINIYQIKTFHNISELVSKRAYHDSFDKIFHYNNTIYLTGNPNLDCFIIKKH